MGSVNKDAEELELSHNAGRNVDWNTHMENFFEVSLKVKYYVINATELYN